MEDLFYNRLKQYFNQDYETVLKKLSQDDRSSIFLNTVKGSETELLKVLDFEYWSSLINPLSYYHNCKTIGKTKAYDLGLIYPQELSASLPAMIPDLKGVKLVVDMASSPGGKTINILNRLNADAIVIANEIDYKRAQVLTSNLERLGFGNAVITNKKTHDLLNLEGQADLVILDAPCSGEGMVKKYPEIIKNYSLANINNCALRQSELLENAYHLVKKGGHILYSTCTFAPEEDEDQVKAFLNKHDDLKLLNFKLADKEYPGMAKFTFLDDMEGQFMAYIAKSGVSEATRLKLKKPVTNKLVDDFILDNLNLQDYYLYQQGEHFYLAMQPLPDMGSHVLRYGIYLGELIKKRFEPSHHLFRANSLNGCFRQNYDLSDDEYLKYLSGNELMVNRDNGYVQITYHNFPLGYGKCVNGMLKNKYPKGLRRML